MSLTTRDRPACYRRGLAFALLVLSMALGIAGCGSFSGQDLPTAGGGTAGGGQITTAIQTIAGNGTSGFNGDGRPLTETALYWPQDTYVDAAGRLWILDWNNHRVRRADSPFGTASTIIGSGFIGDSRSGPANQADLNHPTSITTNPRGGMTLAAWHNWTIKWLRPDANIQVIVGHGFGPQTGGDGGPATNAYLDLTSSAEYDAQGNLYISEQGARRIRKVNASTGMISTFAGTGIPGYGGDGGPAAAAQFNTPRGSDAVPCFKLAIDGQRLYVADSLNNRVRVIDLGSGIIDTFAGTGQQGYSGDGGLARQAQLNFPTDVAIGPDHSVYIADAHNNVVRRVRPDGTIVTAAGNGAAGFAGDGGPPEQAELNDPSGVFVDRTGVLFIADTLNQRIRAARMPG
jgi:DNA-binding beta-propeller fold protein YncE